LAAEHKTSELIAYGKRAVNFALRSGAEEAEAFLSMSSGTSIDIERGQIVRSAKSLDQGLGVRAVYGKAVGFSYTNTLTIKNIEEAASRAFRAARASRPDNDWVNLPSAGRYSETNGTYDKRITDLSSDDLVEMAADMAIMTGGFWRLMVELQRPCSAVLSLILVVLKPLMWAPRLVVPWRR
jgi:hypothetical protein